MQGGAKTAQLAIEFTVIISVSVFEATYSSGSLFFLEHLIPSNATPH